jgi:carboxylesterase type B
MTIHSIATSPASPSSLALSRRLSSSAGGAATSQQPTSRASLLRIAEAALRRLRATIAKDARELGALHAQEIQEHRLTLALTVLARRRGISIQDLSD